MKHKSLKLFIKIDLAEIFLLVGYIDDQDNIKLIETIDLPLVGVSDNKISDIEQITNLIKKNIMLLEQKLSFTFKDTILILNNFYISFLNLTGYQKLNGSQISKENIIYIINSLKSFIDKYENRKKILHIFNSNYFLDKKKIDNIPIGLFGDFYSHELSFHLINENDYKNLKSVFDNCNIKIKKIITDSFLKGTIISKSNPDSDTFFHIQLNENTCKIFCSENDSIKFEQIFKFGTNIITKDISKITSLKLESINKIIDDNPDNNKVCGDELIEQEYFENQKFRKIKKKLILDIAEARIREFADIILLKNINFKNFLNDVNLIYLEINNQKHLNFFRDIYGNSFNSNIKPIVKILKKPKLQELTDAAFKITQFGWEKEAIPEIKETGSYISRIFRALFN